LKKSQQILDHMGSTDLAANLFRATQAEDKLRREKITGKDKAKHPHKPCEILARPHAPGMRTVEHEIGQLLDRLEVEHGFRIVYACESGSRAWGFASPDSDYDIRFLFVRPQRC
jgi:hypothetical protein